ncbi:MAG TPA: allantoinase AllB [Terracidiphilus sp.]|nr:allantoinase AllB [Terracidiphilus sp.]
MAQAFRSTRVLTAGGLAPATLLVEDERISGILSWDAALAGAALRDFGDAVLLPGLVDSHVHINEPGRTEWEGFSTATQAAATGGVTTLVDMPLNCLPETTDVMALEAKRAAAQGKAWVDWAAWGGVVRGNAENLPALAAAGILGFKCFLIHSGIDGFAWVDEPELRLALARLKGTGLPLLAHAEVTGPVDAATEKLNAAGADWRKYATYLASRPDAAEVEAIALLIGLAEEFETPVHIVHLASAQALPLLAAARLRGAPVTVETCVQYLWFAAEEIPDGATEFKCAPPIRRKANREALWAALEEGLIDMATTDHSPCPPAMKRREEGRWDLAWGGIASLGLALPVMWTALHRRGMGLKDGMERVGGWMGAETARLAGLTGRKGVLAAGADADFVVFDPDAEWTVALEDLRFRHKLSPYLGTELRGRVRETWLRGEQIFGPDGFTDQPRGRELVQR